MGGTAVTEAGGVPAPVPTKKLKEHREGLIAMFTAALDVCIAESESGNPTTNGVAPTRFTADITVEYPKSQIKARPAIDLVNDVPTDPTKYTTSAQVIGDATAPKPS